MFFPLFGFLFLLLFVVLFLGISFFASILQALFFSGKRRGKEKSVHGKWTTTAGAGGTASDKQRKETGRKKLFAPDEGEYVDFEEIKEER